jgi:hypothetical protein
MQIGIAAWGHEVRQEKRILCAFSELRGSVSDFEKVMNSIHFLLLAQNRNVTHFPN